MTWLLLFLALALGVSFLCSILEAVLLSITPSYIATLEDGSRLAGRLEHYKKEIDRPLAAILSLNTIAHTVGATGVGAQAAAVFGDGYLGVVSGVLTLLILFFSEIIPKTLGAVFWRQLAPSVAWVLQPIIWSMYPLVKMSEWTRRLLVPNQTAEVINREELAAMARLGQEAGVIGDRESRILASLFDFHSFRVHEIMTPRTVVFALPEDSTVAEAIAVPGDLEFSRIPVYGQSLDQVTGYVLKDELLLRGAQDQTNLPLSELTREILVVPGSLTLVRLLRRLLATSEHIALVVDEYGGTAGLVTMEDVVETLLGLEIVDEVDSVEDMRELARDRWRLRSERFHVVEPPAKETD